MSNTNRLTNSQYSSMRWKLVLPLGLLILILVALTPVVSNLIAGQIEQAADRRLGESASSVQGLLESSQTQAINAATILSTQPEIVGAFGQGGPHTDAILKLKDRLRLQEISLYPANFKPGDPAMFSSGSAISASPQISQDVTQTRDSLVLKALQDGVSAGAIMIAPQGSQIMGVAMVRTQDGSGVIGAVLASFYVDKAFIDNIGNTTGAELAIAKDNQVIVSSILARSNYDRIVTDGSLAATGTINETITYPDGRQDRLLAKPLMVSGKNQGDVLVAQPIPELLTIVRSVQTTLLIICVALALITLWLWMAALPAVNRPLSQLSEELAAAHDQIAVVNQSKSEFISTVSHELKIPMTSIRGYSDLMIAGATGPMTEKQLEFLNIIGTNVSRMAMLVSDLSDISRIETGRVRIEPGEVDARAMIEDSVKLSNKQFEQKKQTVTVDISTGLPKVWCDKNRLRQILTILISNANQYTPEGGMIAIQAVRKIHACDEREPQDVVQIQVRDNGFGMTSEDQEKLFTKFFRSADDQIRAAPGTGLGLSIAKSLVELQNGCLWFESEYRKGTTFYFTIPVHKPEV